jgi:hypothetical protein
MTRPLVLLVAAGGGIALYDIVAYRTRRAPTITHIVHATRTHFRPHCRGCNCNGVRPLVPLNEHRYRGWHTARPT